MGGFPKQIEERLSELFSSETEIQLAISKPNTADLCSLSVAEFKHVYGRDLTVDFLTIAFKSVNDYIGCEFSVMEAQECMSVLTIIHGNLNLADFSEFFGHLKLTTYGKFFGKVTISEIIAKFNAFYFDAMARKAKFAVKIIEQKDVKLISLDEWIEDKKKIDPNFIPEFDVEAVKKTLK